MFSRSPVCPSCAEFPGFTLCSLLPRQKQLPSPPFGCSTRVDLDSGSRAGREPRSPLSIPFAGAPCLLSLLAPCACGLPTRGEPRRRRRASPRTSRRTCSRTSSRASSAGPLPPPPPAGSSRGATGRRTRDPMWNTYGYPSPTAKGGWVYLTGGDASYTEGDSGGAFLQTGGRARLTLSLIHISEPTRPY